MGKLISTFMEVKITISIELEHKKKLCEYVIIHLWCIFLIILYNYFILASCWAILASCWAILASCWAILACSYWLALYRWAIIACRYWLALYTSIILCLILIVLGSFKNSSYFFLIHLPKGLWLFR